MIARADDDPDGRYVIEFRAPNPCVRPEFLRAQKTKIKGKRNAQLQRQALRDSGYTILRFERCSWWSW